MKQTTKGLLVGAAMITAGIFGNWTKVEAQEWIPRTAQEIQADMQTDENGSTTYSIKWGDTLSVISEVSGVSVSLLTQMNDIRNASLIYPGTVLIFSANNERITVETEAEASTYQVSGETVEEVQETASSSEQAAEAVQESQEAVATTSSALYSLSEFMFRGVINWNGYKFTYYSQSVLPGGGLSIPGRHVNADGYVSDGDGYIVLAGSAPIGTVYDTPFGYKGKIYDRGTSGNHLDVYIR